MEFKMRIYPLSYAKWDWMSTLQRMAFLDQTKLSLNRNMKKTNSVKKSRNNMPVQFKKSLNPLKFLN